jgi:hypothetical protein
LLLLVAPVGAPGLDALVGVTSGVIAVDTPPQSVKRFPVLATVDQPETPHAPRRSAIRPRAWWSLTAAALVVIAVLAWRARTARAPASGSPPARARSPAASRTPATPPASRGVSADTLRLADPVSLPDSAALAPFAVEVVAASTLAGANSLLAEHRETASLRGATVSPVTVGGGSTLWYKVIVGACPDRGCADELLEKLRRDDVARAGGGRVVRLPYALLLADHVDRAQVSQLVGSWAGRGITPYALVQTDGSARVFAGAFETPAQAAPLAVALRAARVAPVVAFRTGRMF